MYKYTNSFLYAARLCVISKNMDSSVINVSSSRVQHCFICCPSDSTVSEEAGIEPRTVASFAMAVRRNN
jgi:hypothetical protein